MAVAIEMDCSEDREFRLDSKARKLRLVKKGLSHPLRFLHAVRVVKSIQRRRELFDMFNSKIKIHHPAYVVEMQTTTNPEKQRIAREFRVDRINQY